MVDTSISDLMKNLKLLFNPALSPQEIMAEFNGNISRQLIDLNLSIKVAPPDSLFAMFKYNHESMTITAHLYERVNHKVIVLLIENHNNSIQE